MKVKFNTHKNKGEFSNINIQNRHINCTNNFSYEMWKLQSVFSYRDGRSIYKLLIYTT